MEISLYNSNTIINKVPTNTPENEISDSRTEVMTIDELLSLHGIQLEGPVSCDFCSKTFDDMDEFDLHMADSVHEEARFYSCQLCHNTYVSWANLVAHRKACHKGDVLSCENCSQKKYYPKIGRVNYAFGEFPIACEECDSGFTSMVDLYKHYRTYGNHILNKEQGSVEMPLNRPINQDDVDSKSSKANVVTIMPQTIYVCPICTVGFYNSEQISKHLEKLGNNETCYPCDLCDHKFCNPRLLENHKRSHVSVSKKKALCNICGKVVSDITSLRRHLKIHSGGSPLKCFWCHKTFSRHSTLYQHSFLHPIRDPWNCNDCSLSFYEWQQLENHVKEVHSKDKINCSCCGSKFNCEDFIIHYPKCHSDKEERFANRRRSKVTCPVCSKIFSQPSGLRRHIKLHNADAVRRKLHACDYCQEKDMKRGIFIRHLLIHFEDYSKFPDKYQKIVREYKQNQKYRYSAVKKCICEYCGKEFQKMANLLIHVRRHTGDKPHKCHLCSREFFTQQQLKNHLRAHTGEKPFICPFDGCGKSFSSSSARYMHHKTHNKTKEFICNYCGKTFFWRSTFVSHIRMHRGERPYPCPKCTAAFTMKGKLTFHMKRCRGNVKQRTEVRKEQPRQIQLKEGEYIVLNEEQFKDYIPVENSAVIRLYVNDNYLK